MRLYPTKRPATHRIVIGLTAAIIGVTGFAVSEIAAAAPSLASDQCPVYTSDTAGVLSVSQESVLVFVPAGRRVQVELHVVDGNGNVRSELRLITNVGRSGSNMWLDATPGTRILTATITQTLCAPSATH